MAFRTFQDTAEAAEYATSLDTRWPDRSQVKAHLSEQLHLPSTAHVVEFCAGAGALATQLLADHPTARYLGLDISAPLLEVARLSTAHHAPRVAWLETDLNADAWLEHLPSPVHAFVSLQSLHDLGDETAVARMFALAAHHLAPGGSLVYADLLAEPDGSSGPGRLTVERHLELLAESGFSDVACTLTVGPFGCFHGRTRG